MNVLFTKLKRNQRRGSKPRCHLLTHGPRDVVAKRLTGLAAPFAIVDPNDYWMPQGFDDINEAILPDAIHLLSESVRVELMRWWLVVAARTPNWDIASTCSVDGKRGILLIEAKAHDQELIKEETGRKNIDAPVSVNARRNLLRIDWALRDASLALAGETNLPWSLSRDWNYQISNRIAWAWKLTDLGIPVVLVYLGFLNANEMSDQGRPLADAEAWQSILANHSRNLFPAEVWGRRWICGGQSLVPLIRSIDIPLLGEIPI